jgi:hypothetical protein
MGDLVAEVRAVTEQFEPNRGLQLPQRHHHGVHHLGEIRLRADTGLSEGMAWTNARPQRAIAWTP